MKRIGARIGLAVATAAAALTAGLLATAFAPTLFGAESLIVTSGSMGKAMPVGSVAVTRLVDVRSITAGDIISFRSPGARVPTTHRVIAVTNDGGRIAFHTKGDANPAPDPQSVSVDGRVHVVERVVPFAGRVAVFARSPWGIVLLVLVPIAGLVFDRRRAAQAVAAAPVEPMTTTPDTTTPAPLAVTAAVVGAVCGGIAAGLLMRRVDRHARAHARIAS